MEHPGGGQVVPGSQTEEKWRENRKEARRERRRGREVAYLLLEGNGFRLTFSHCVLQSSHLQVVAWREGRREGRRPRVREGLLLPFLRSSWVFFVPPGPLAFASVLPNNSGRFRSRLCRRAAGILLAPAIAATLLLSFLLPPQLPQLVLQVCGGDRRENQRIGTGSAQGERGIGCSSSLSLLPSSPVRLLASPASSTPSASRRSSKSSPPSSPPSPPEALSPFRVFRASDAKMFVSVPVSSPSPSAGKPGLEGERTPKGSLRGAVAGTEREARSVSAKEEGEGQEWGTDGRRF